MTPGRLERVFVWLGGAAFVAALAATGHAFVVQWRPGRVAPEPSWTAAAFDAALFLGFAVHHSVFARANVKAWVARAVPDRLLRSFYVWTASVLLLGVIGGWQPIGGLAYHVTGPSALLLGTAQVAGLLLIVRSVRLIDALELAGVRQRDPRETLQVRGPYRFVRHPLYLGWVLAVAATAGMTGDRLAFGAYSICYLVVAIPWEERSLHAAFGAAYADYARRVRWRVVPYVY